MLCSPFWIYFYNARWVNSLEMKVEIFRSISFPHFTVQLRNCFNTIYSCNKHELEKILMLHVTIRIFTVFKSAFEKIFELRLLQKVGSFEMGAFIIHSSSVETYTWEKIIIEKNMVEISWRVYFTKANACGETKFAICLLPYMHFNAISFAVLQYHLNAVTQV